MSRVLALFISSFLMKVKKQEEGRSYSFPPPPGEKGSKTVTKTG